MKLSENRQKITDEIFHVINDNNDLHDKIENLYKTKEMYWFLKNLILDKDPNLTIIIESKKDNIEEEKISGYHRNPV